MTRVRSARTATSFATIAFVAIASLASPGVARAVPTDPVAKGHLERGNAAYARGDFKTAVDEYRKGFAKQDDPAFLYTWAQAERRRNDCASAVKLYQRYLATDPPQLSAEYARDGILKCAEILAGDFVMPPGDAAAGDDGDEPIVDDEVDPESTPAPDDRRKWPRDPAAAVLVSFGAAGVLASTGVLVAASIDNNRPSTDYGVFDDRQQRVRRFQIGGGVALGVGVGLLAGGIARWMLLRNREKRQGDTQVSAMLGRGTVGLTLGRRF